METAWELLDSVLGTPGKQPWDEVNIEKTELTRGRNQILGDGIDLLDLALPEAELLLDFFFFVLSHQPTHLCGF